VLIENEILEIPKAAFNSEHALTILFSSVVVSVIDIVSAPSIETESNSNISVISLKAFLNLSFITAVVKLLVPI